MNDNNYNHKMVKQYICPFQNKLQPLFLSGKGFSQYIGTGLHHPGRSFSKSELLISLIKQVNAPMVKIQNGTY